MEENKNLTSEQIAEMIAKAVELNSSALFEKLNKLPSFKEEEKKVEEKKEKDAFRKLYDGEISKYVVNYKATNIEGTSNLGGYLVPTEEGWYVPNLNDFGLVRSRARLVQMNRDKMNFPYTSTDLVAYNVNEAQAITASNYVFGQLQLDATKYGSITTVSNELLQDTFYPVSGIVMESLTKQFAGAEDALFVTRLKALGASQVQAATATGSFATTVSAGSGSYDVCLNLISKLETINMGYVNGATFIMSPSVYNTLAKVKDTSGQYVVSMINDIPSIQGYPIVKSNKFATATDTTDGALAIAFGNMQNVYFGSRMNMELYLAKEGTVGSDSLLQSDLSAFRAISRFDVQIDPSSFVVYKIKG